MIDLFTSDSLFTEDEIFTKRQYAKHICFALKRYFETHLIIKAQSLIRSNLHSQNNSANFSRLIDLNLPAYKPINYDYDLIMEHVEAMLHLVPLGYQWDPVEQLTKY